jgi:hypothetical protein
MGLKTWFFNLFDRQKQQDDGQNTLTPASQTDIQQQNMDKEAAGLNFKLAIEAHQKWKRRLLDVIDGNSDETLQVEVVSRDDQCLLGKWIHGTGSLKFRSTEPFIRLKHNHARFHECAGHVLQMAQAGEQTAAASELKDGDYALISQEVVRDLVAVYTQVEFKPK